MNQLFENPSPRRRAPVNQDASADVVFIAGGLKAAQNSRSAVRNNVLGDVSEALNCQPEDLSFLFNTSSASETESDIFDFPDAERRRMVIHKNHLDIAE